MAVSAAEEGKQSKQAEQEGDHRAETFSGSAPPDQSLGAGRSFGEGQLVDANDGRVRIRLEGGCQGCSLAEVTVRQGIERLLRERVPEVSAVVDVTDHRAGE